MRTLIWLVAGLLAAVWTGMVALTVQLSDWLLNAVATAPTPGQAPGPLPGRRARRVASGFSQ